MTHIQPSVTLESGTQGNCGCSTSPCQHTPLVSQDVLQVRTVTTLPGSAYVLAINNGEMVKITIDNLKKIL